MAPGGRGKTITRARRGQVEQGLDCFKYGESSSKVVRRVFFLAHNWVTPSRLVRGVKKIVGPHRKHQDSRFSLPPASHCPLPYYPLYSTSSRINASLRILADIPIDQSYTYSYQHVMYNLRGCRQFVGGFSLPYLKS